MTVTAEAASGTVTAPTQVASDTNASAGQYVTVAAGNNSKSDSPVLADLTAGAHTLTVAYREDGAQLDRVLVTEGPSLLPAT